MMRAPCKTKHEAELFGAGGEKSEVWAAIAGKTRVLQNASTPGYGYYATRPDNATLECTAWNVLQYELMPGLRAEVGVLAPKLEKVAYTLERVRIEEFVGSSWLGIGRTPARRGKEGAARSAAL